MLFKYFSLILLFLCSSCSFFTPKKNIYFQESTCFIIWKKLEHKEKYEKGLLLSRKDKENQNLLFATWENPTFIIFNKNNDDTYDILFNISDNTPIELLKKQGISSENELNKLRKEIFKFKHFDLENFSKKYEEVSCSQLMTSQIEKL